MKNRLYILIIILAALVTIFIMIYLPGYSHYQELARKETHLEQQIESFHKKNAKMEKELQLLQTDVTYLEKVVRDRMGLVKPGEEVYKFIEEDEHESAVIPDAPEQLSQSREGME